MHTNINHVIIRPENLAFKKNLFIGLKMSTLVRDNVLKEQITVINMSPNIYIYQYFFKS